MHTDHFNGATRHEAFLHRHGEAERHPERRRLWLFADGAQYLEPMDGMDAVYAEPSAVPLQLLPVVIAYLNARYTRVWNAFTAAETRLDIPTLQQLGEEIKTLRTQMSEAEGKYRALPEVQAEAERELESVQRESAARQFQEMHQQRVRDEVQRIVADVREFNPAAPAPVVTEPHPTVEPEQTRPRRPRAAAKAAT